jgi:hypothetical protein
VSQTQTRSAALDGDAARRDLVPAELQAALELEPIVRAPTLGPDGRARSRLTGLADEGPGLSPPASR